MAGGWVRKTHKQQPSQREGCFGGTKELIHTQKQTTRVKREGGEGG